MPYNITYFLANIFQAFLSLVNPGYFFKGWNTKLSSYYKKLVE